MTRVSVSAPGKAVVSGEYAVLAGAPAISMAVNRRAVVSIVPAKEEFHRVATPGHADGLWRFSAADGGEISWIDPLPAKGLKLVDEAWRVASVRAVAPLSIVIDTRDFSDAASGRKLGLGSSAAAMTALVAALCQLGHNPESAGLLSQRAHSALQGGLGSGVDVATSLYGGIIEYRTGDEAGSIRHSWPGRLAYRLLWSGQPAMTTARIDKLGQPNPTDRGWASLIDAAQAVASNWMTGRTADILDAVRAYTTTLGEFDLDRSLGIFDAGHGELAGLADAGDVVYKPCGAGGGDIGIALSSDERAVIRFCELAEARGFRRLPVKLDLCGTRTSVGDGCIE